MDAELSSALEPGVGPPQRIDSGDLLIRRWQPEDLMARFEAITTSFEHLQCDAANLRSAAVARRLGYRLDRVAPRERRAPAESGHGMYWIRQR
ncbi:hypothetical protein [Nocardia tengchongensis]|uniref:hypothetical protein n=1 Tax=Nocardia tengchongensis TaxID=2055889 RepID=UPI00369E2C11